MALEQEIASIEAALRIVSDPPAEIKRASSQLRTLERKLEQHNALPEEAVKEYNKARRQLLIDAAKSKGLGYCSRGNHFAPLAEIEGLIVSGASVSSGYYETLSGFEYRKTVCKAGRHGLKGGPGRYDGEYTSYDTFDLKDPLDSLDQITSDPQLEQLAKKIGTELAPEASLDRNARRVTIGETKLT